MPVNIGFFTYLTASLGFAVLAALLVIVWRVKPLGRSLFLACAASSAWASAIALGTVSPYPPISVIQISELIRDACWIFLLLQLLSLQNDGTLWSIKGRRWRRVFFPVVGASLSLTMLHPLLPTVWQNTALYSDLTVSLYLLFSLLGLLLIEQLIRNATDNERWSIKYLCFGLGAVLVYDFFMYSEALLFRHLDAELWQARGLVNAVVTPWLAVAMARNDQWRINLHVSRQVAFHTVTLMGAGLYLIGIALTGYFIQLMGGSWGGVLQVSFLAAAGTLLLSLLFSGKLRARTRVFLSKHFFSYSYDYREEWLKFTHALAELNHNVTEGVIRIMAPLASSTAGLLWAGSDDQPMHLVAHWQMRPPPAATDGLGELPDWLQRTDWVIDLQEWRRAPDLYGDIPLPAWLREDTQLWLIIPLVFRDRVQAVLLLKRSDLKHSINWEDRDLLKTAGRQAATHLAQHLASQSLVEARQFDAFNRLSAYVVHDLKNILAQQSLIVSNASKHRNNAAFVDDMISTVANSVERMRRLMEQMRSGVRDASACPVDVRALLTEVIQGRKTAMPIPRAMFAGQTCTVKADRERLATVFNHLIQNAQEATDRQGTVSVRLVCAKDRVAVDIEDNGRGMDENFIRERLFRPFDSTKGLTGMGIGVFESRDYIRQLGGDISVVSTAGEGSVFHITIPAYHARESPPQSSLPANERNTDTHMENTQ